MSQCLSSSAAGGQGSADAGIRWDASVGQAGFAGPDPRDPIGYPSAGLIVVAPVVAVGMVSCGGSALTGGLAGIQQPGWLWLPQQLRCLRTLIKVLDAAIRTCPASLIWPLVYADDATDSPCSHAE